MKIAPFSRWIFIGDSITDAGRDPGGELTPWNRSTGLGAGYVAYAQALLDVFAPESRLRLINKGVSGETVIDLAARWQTDVLEPKPDWLSVMIGINDVWRQFDCPLRGESHVTISKFSRTYRALLEKTRPALKGLVLLAPYVIERYREDPMRCLMSNYAEIVRALAREYDAAFIDTQAAMDRLLQHLAPTELAWDRIHPGPTGHMAIATALLDGIGLAWEAPSRF